VPGFGQTGDGFGGELGPERDDEMLGIEMPGDAAESTGQRVATQLMLDDVDPPGVWIDPADLTGDYVNAGSGETGEGTGYRRWCPLPGHQP
jgi:hypothetical protein